MAQEKVQNCGECTKWNEHWYWTHLAPNQIRFSKPLKAGFDQHLVVPRKIVMKFREKLVNNTATLKSLSGKAWKVGLEERNEELYFKQGWGDFVRVHSLKKGDMLIFQCGAEDSFTFTVSMFDGETGYEKVGSSHLWQTRETNDVHVDYPSSSDDDDDDSSDESYGYSSSMKNSYDEGSDNHGKASHHPVNEKIEIKEESDEDYNPPMKKTRKGKSVCSKEPSSSRGADIGSKIINLDKSYGTYFVSRRRPVSEAEKEKAFQLASAFRSNKPSFIVSMLPTHVCKRFFLTISQGFVREHIPRSTKEAVLCVPPDVKKTWIVTYDGYRSYGVGLSGGWMNFVWDNNLEEGDVCVFQLLPTTQQLRPENKNVETISMDVKIFRVVKKITPLNKVRRNILTKGGECSSEGT